MRARIEQLIAELRERVKLNLETVHRNEALIRDILKEPLGGSRKNRLEDRFALSRRILAENKDNLELQATLVNFVNKHKEIPEFSEMIHSIEERVGSISKLGEEKLQFNSNNHINEAERTEEHSEMLPESEPETTTIKEPTFEGVLNQTIEGEIAYNSFHPLFGNEKFFNRLMNYHVEREEYERCSELMKAKGEG